MLTRLLLLLLATQLNMGFAQSTRPNIVFIMTDDHAKRAVSIYDTALIHTPNIDRIGQEGIVFRNAFVTNSICGPSRAVMLTGKYSHINGFRDNNSRFDGSQQTFPKILRANGYYTAMIGKWHLVSEPAGFDYWNVLIDQGYYYNPDMIEMGDTLQQQGYSTNIITDLAIETLEKRWPQNQPFCLFVHQKAPHRNWMPDTTHLDLFNDRDMPLPSSFFDDYEGRSRAAEEQDMRVEDMFLGYDLKLYLQEMEDETGTGGLNTTKHPFKLEWELGRLNEEQQRAWEAHYRPISEAFYQEKPHGPALVNWKYQRYIKDYLRCISSVDDNVGRLMAYLEKAGLLENTIVVYTSDQGFFLGEHGWYDKRFMYEPSLSMPLLMRFPEKIKPGTASENIVLNLDFAPTLLEVASITAPPDMQGRSLLPLFDDGREKGWRKSMYYHYYEYPHGMHYAKRHYGIRTDRYKLIHFYNDIDEWELYDLENDPEELQNLYGQPKYRKLAKKLKKELARLQKQYGDTEAQSKP